MEKTAKKPQQLIFKPHESVGPLIIGSSKEEVRKIMKKTFNCDPDEFEEDREYYKNVNIIVEYDNDKLLWITIFANPRIKALEIMYDDMRIWPRQKSYFLNLFKNDNLFELEDYYYDPKLDFCVRWCEGTPELVICPQGYSLEHRDSVILSNYLPKLKKGMLRNTIQKKCMKS